MSAEESCVFCRIVQGDLPATVVNRADGFVAIEDIAPKAPVHLLVIPYRHVSTFRDVESFAAEEAKAMLDFLAATAAQVGLEEYRVIVNVGPGAGQTVFHLHWHLLGGRALPFP